MLAQTTIANQITDNVSWDDIIVNDDVMESLQRISGYFEDHKIVYDDWGLRRTGVGQHGKGAFFFGPEGTGKTLAATVIAKSIDVPLYHVDLRKAENSYAGETEKGIHLILEYAEKNDCVLFFDEADALFGKHLDAHGSSGTLATDYFLDRIKRVKGLAIVATDHNRYLDKAFTDALDFSVQFTVPNEDQRRQIWEKAFPSVAPAQGLKFDELAKLELSGGMIHEIAIQVAFDAAHRGGPIETQMILDQADARHGTERKTDVPKKFPRPRAFDDDPRRYQLRYRRIPEYILRDGSAEPVKNPLRDRVIYVVHGMGEQEDTETAATLRWGIEDAVPELDPENWKENQENRWILPEPYIQDGFWARYDDISWLAPEIFRDLTEKQKLFFNDLWKRRAIGAFRSWAWLVRRGWMLVYDIKWRNKIVYAYLTVLISLIGLGMLLFGKTRNVLSHYVNDVRLYLAPKGDVEHEIVQRIDRRVGAQFLELLGLDWDFEELPLNKRLYVGRETACFDEVTWVAHSLGTVISYNVISDILHKCQQIRRDQPERIKTVERVESGLTNFITLGSPLDKIFYLFEELPDEDPATVLRRWPECYLKGDLALKGSIPGPARNTNDPKTKAAAPLFWLNFYYMSDPIGGHLGKFVNEDSEPIVANMHTTGVRVPGLAHIMYWKDKKIIQRIVELTFHGFTKHIPIKQRPGWVRAIGATLSWGVWLLVAALIASVISFAAYKLIFQQILAQLST